MSQLKRGILALAGMVVVVLSSTMCISVPDDLDTEGCIKECTTALAGCLNVEIDCNEGDACLIEANACFAEADDYIEWCAEQDDESCVAECSELVEGCVNVMWRCIGEKEICLRQEKSDAMACLTPYGNCAAACVGEAEDVIRNM